MKRIAIVLWMILSFLPVISLANDFPNPVGFVNDFANEIPEEAEKRIEAKLRDYEKQTSIEIVVITTPSLNGEDIQQWTVNLLSKDKWKIGKKGLDNGVAIVHAPTERKYWINTGYGVEGDLPDSLVGQLGREILVPSFKQGKFAEGIEEAVVRIIKVLGTNEELIEKRKKAAELKAAQTEQQLKDQQAARELIAYIFIVAVLGFVIGAIVYGIVFSFKKISETRRERRRKKELQLKVDRDIFGYQKNISELQNRMKTAEKAGADLPAWTSEKISDYSRKISEKLFLVSEALNEGSTINKNNPDLAEDKIENVGAVLDRWGVTVTQMEDIPLEVKQFKKMAEDTIKESGDTLEKLKTALSSFKSQGFIVAEFEKFLNDTAGKVLEIKWGWEKSDDKAKNLKARDTYRSACQIHGEVSDNLKKLNKLNQNKDYINSELKKVAKQIFDLNISLNGASQILERIKKNNPNEVWKDVEAEFGLISKQIKDGSDLIKSAEEKNSMKVQQFTEAEKDLTRAVFSVSTAANTLNAVRELEQKIEKSKKFFTSQFDSTAKSVAEAVEKAKNSDAGVRAKSIAKDADVKFRQAKLSGNCGEVNWIAVFALLSSAAILATEAFNIAEKDIAEAVKKRKKKKSSNSGSSIYVSTPHCDKDDDDRGGRGGNDNFGGFGGGETGGGGAGGEY